MEFAYPAIDSHAHVFVRGLSTAPRPRYVPGYDAAPEAYLAVLDRQGISGALLVQPSFLGCDNSFLLACLRRFPRRFRGVLVLSADEPGALAPLAVPGVAGVRLNLIGRRVPDLRGTAWRDLADALARNGQHFEVQAIGEQWAALAPALRHWPSAVVIDHLGLPGVSASADRAVLGLIRREHVWIKASAPYRSPAGAAARMLDRIVAERGPDRLLWGSDWPWTRHESGRTYPEGLAWLRERVRDDVFDAATRRNPAELLRWSPCSPVEAAATK